ncbi:YopX family protein [Bacillus pseudomycoides]|uniref:YopX family protein n=1 Tax=Bacillus pseudomycoides TaxID=64104 RepID=UPI001FB47BD2|nr:YopX family protein [Bacillus pseudomycoides]
MSGCKVRTWDKKAKVMEQYHYLQLSPNGQLYHDGMNVTDNYEIMQCTGVKSSEGTEIYEGDIVRIFIPNDPEKKEYTSKVYKLDGALAVDMVGYDIYTDVYCIGWIPEDYCVEVIGNIYENAELLKN